MKLGVVKTIVGNAYAVDESGVQRSLKTGSEVNRFDVLYTEKESAIELSLLDGSSVTLGQGTQIVLNESFFEQPELLSQQQDSDVDSIQQAILEGDDPTQNQQPTAAGAGADAESNEGVDFVQVDYLSPAVTPEAGFDTTGINTAFDEPAEEAANILTDNSLFGPDDNPGDDNPSDDGPVAETTTIQFDEDNLINQVLTPNVVAIIAEFDAANTFSESKVAETTGIDDIVIGDDLPVGASTNATGRLDIDFGSIGAAETRFLDAAQQPSGFTSGGQPVSFWVSDDGLSLVGFVVTPQNTAEILLTAEITSTDGDFNVNLFGALDHPNSTSEDNLLLNLAIEATDNDNNSEQVTLQVDVDDDRAAVSSADLSELIYTLNVDYLGGNAGYKNSFGYYIKDANGEPVSGAIIWNNVKEQSASTMDLGGYTPDQVGFFIIPNGGHLNSSIADGTPVTFVETPTGEWRAYADGNALNGAGAKILFDTAALNTDGIDHVIDNEVPGNQNWEDISGGGDRDFDDVNISTSWSVTSASGGLNINFGADGEGGIDLSDSVFLFDSDGNLVSELYSNGKVITFESKDINSDGSLDLVGSTEDGEVLSITALLDSQEYEVNVLGPLDSSASDITIQANGELRDGDGDVTGFTLDINLAPFINDSGSTTTSSSELV